MSETIWIIDPMTLIREYDSIKISSENNFVTNLNNLSRIILYITIISFLLTRNASVLLSGVFSLAIFVIVYYLRENKLKSGFDIINNDAKESTRLSKKNLEDYYPIKEENPLSNVMPGDYMNNPARKKAAPAYDATVSNKINNTTKKMITEKNLGNKNLENKLFRDLGDNYKFDESMINFYTTASSEIPNNQGEFAKFCYGNMPSCKEGNEFACAKKDLRYINY